MPKLYNQPPPPWFSSSFSRIYSRGKEVCFRGGWVRGNPCPVMENIHVPQMGAPSSGQGWACTNTLCFLMPSSSSPSLHLLQLHSHQVSCCCVPELGDSLPPPIVFK